MTINPSPLFDDKSEVTGLGLVLYLQSKKVIESLVADYITVGCDQGEIQVLLRTATNEVFKGRYAIVPRLATEEIQKGLDARLQTIASTSGVAIRGETREQQIEQDRKREIRWYADNA